MKRYFSAILVILFLGVYTSCEELEQIPTYASGATVVVANQAGIFDLTNLGTSVVTFDLDTYGPSNLPVSSVTIWKSLNGGTPIQHADISSFPAAISVTPDQAVDGTGSTTQDLVAGDVFDLVFDVVTSSGTYRAKSSISISATCTSDMGGTYNVATAGDAGGGAGSYNVTSTETVTDNGDGLYTVSDISGGMYPQFWGGSAEAGDFLDVCNVLTVQAFTDQWGDTFTGSGNRNQDGSFSLTWENTYGDNGVSDYTPQ